MADKDKKDKEGGGEDASYGKLPRSEPVENVEGSSAMGKGRTMQSSAGDEE